MENLGSGTSQKDPTPAMDEPGTASVQTLSLPTTTKDYLCERCESISNSLPTKKVEDQEFDFHLDISTESLSVGCIFCSQLRNIVESFPNVSQCSNSEGYFDLYCLATEPCHNGKYRDIYFSIHSSDRHTINIFPTQGINDEVAPIGRIVYPYLPDYEFIRAQLDFCDKYHERTCGRSQAAKQSLRVIDCNSRRLVRASPEDTYACLSYVWGSGAATDNKEFDNELPAHVPKTIEDAIAVTIALGIPYLWVDRYCIDQGNVQEKHDTVRNMNRIYEGAEITIIAAIGDDPHHGLPGVRGTPRKSQLRLNIGDRTFVSVDEPHDEIPETKWSTRGWTYQEMLLSRRRLVFTRSQMYFQCYLMYCMESFHFVYPTSFHGSSYGIEVFPSRGIGYTTVSLQSRLEEYYHRQLSFDTDTIDAFDGIVTAFDDSEQFPFRVTQFYGVPMLYQCHDEHLALKSFLQNISWYFENACYKSPGKKKRKNIFPSWSWASAKVDGLSGKLAFLKIDSTMDDLWQNNDVEVRVSHRKGGDMDLHAFSLHKDKYQTFLPDLKITTWVTGYPLPPPDGAVMPGISQFDYEPSEYCYVAYTGMISHGHFFQFFAMILEEFEPEVFQRIGQWSLEISMETTSTSTRDVLEDLGELIRMNDEEEDEEYTHHQLHWKRRTIRII